MEIISYHAALPPVLRPSTADLAQDNLSWLRPGMLLSGIVQGTAEKGLLQVEVKGRLLALISELQLAKGTQVELKVEQQDDNVVLRVLRAQHDTTPIIQQAMLRALPRQQPLAPLFDNLTRLLGATESGQTPLSPSERQSLSTLLQQLPAPLQLTSAEGLRKAIATAGLWFVAQPNQSTFVPPPEQSLSVLLLRIAVVLRQAVALRLPQGQIPANTQDEGRTTQDALTSRLLTLTRQSEGAIARLQLHQLHALQTQQQGDELLLNLEIPLYDGSNSEVLELKIRRERKENDASATPGWSVTLKLDTPTHGAIRAVVSLLNGSIATTFWCERQETQRHFTQHLDTLRQRLQQQGLTTDKIQALVGVPPERAEAIPQSNLINLQA